MSGLRITVRACDCTHFMHDTAADARAPVKVYYCCYLVVYVLSSSLASDYITHICICARTCANSQDSMTFGICLIHCTHEHQGGKAKGKMYAIRKP